MTEQELQDIKRGLSYLPTATELRNAYALTEENKASLIFEMNHDEQDIVAMNFDYQVIEHMIEVLTTFKQHLDNLNGEK